MSLHLMEGITPAFARPDAIVNNASNRDVGFAFNHRSSMAKRLSEREVASVRLLVLELSEDELTVLAAALTTLLKERDDRAVEAQFGASREEVEAILDDLHTFLKQPTRQSMTS
jgi:hypothetical protein